MFNSIKIANEDFENLSNLEKIKFGVKLLVDKKIAKLELFDLIKDSLDKYGPYWVFDNGVAVAHAQPSRDCISVGVSMILSKKGFYLFDKKINLLFTLSVPLNGDHMDLLQKVINAVRDEKEKEKLLNLKEI